MCSVLYIYHSSSQQQVVKLCGPRNALRGELFFIQAKHRGGRRLCDGRAENLNALLPLLPPIPLAGQSSASAAGAISSSKYNDRHAAPALAAGAGDGAAGSDSGGSPCWGGTCAAAAGGPLAAGAPPPLVARRLHDARLRAAAARLHRGQRRGGGALCVAGDPRRLDVWRRPPGGGDRDQHDADSARRREGRPLGPAVELLEPFDTSLPLSTV